VTIARGSRLRSRVAATIGEQSSEGQERVARKPVRSRPKRDEPQGRIRVQHPETVEEEQTVEVVRNHEGGTRSGVANPIRWRERGNVRTQPSGLPD